MLLKDLLTLLRCIYTITSSDELLHLQQFHYEIWKIKIASGGAALAMGLMGSSLPEFLRRVTHCFKD